MAAVRSEQRNFQDDINRACNVTLEDYFDLMQIMIKTQVPTSSVA